MLDNRIQPGPHTGRTADDQPLPTDPRPSSDGETAMPVRGSSVSMQDDGELDPVSGDENRRRADRPDDAHVLRVDATDSQRPHWHSVALIAIVLVVLVAAMLVLRSSTTPTPQRSGSPARHPVAVTDTDRSRRSDSRRVARNDVPRVRHSRAYVVGSSALADRSERCGASCGPARSSDTEESPSPHSMAPQPRTSGVPEEGGGVEFGFEN